ncbi:hypothetical protein EVA_19628 [gut metagenome]|uniref:Uncharacterized protein n=1 Tax=gut metagenome TaxID=749906 RepID=J9FBI6_9ZZZZ
MNIIHQSTPHIPIFCTTSQIDIPKDTLVHTFLYFQIKHRLLFTVINTGNTCQVRFFIVSFKFVNHIHRQILQPSLHISAKELLAIHHQFFNFLTIDFHISIIIYLGTRQFLHQFFQHSPFRRTIGRRIECNRIFQHLHLWSLSYHYSLSQHNSIRFQMNRPDIFLRNSPCKQHRNQMMFITNIRNL